MIAMYRNNLIGVTVPVYNEEAHVERVVETMPPYVDRVYVVDDASTDGTWERAKRAAERVNAQVSELVNDQDNTSQAVVEESPNAFEKQVVVIQHEENRGVGGAIKTGYRRALQDEIDVVAVMAGDGQMDPAFLEMILDPVVEGKADYAKGNRFMSRETQQNIPRFRWVGNLLLSFLTKISSGYWTIGDSQNGYAAISRRALQRIRIDEMYEFYGYCNDLLVKLNVNELVVADVPMSIIYDDETSHIQYRTYIPLVSGMLFRNFLWRLKERYVMRDFHPLVLLYAFGLLGFVSMLLRTVRSRGTAEGRFSHLVQTGMLSVLFFVLAMIHDRWENQHLNVQDGPISGIEWEETD